VSLVYVLFFKYRSQNGFYQTSQVILKEDLEQRNSVTLNFQGFLVMFVKLQLDNARNVLPGDAETSSA
jgi:hypothetical protein